jgi:hypothetical protein
MPVCCLKNEKNQNYFEITKPTVFETLKLTRLFWDTLLELRAGDYQQGLQQKVCPAKQVHRPIFIE